MKPILMLAAVAGLCLLARGAAGQTVGVWQPPADTPLAAEPADMVDLLSDDGFDARTISTDELLDPAALTAERIPLLVIPTVGVYPDDGVPVLEDYLRAGGRVLSVGGVPFSRPLVRGEDGWQTAAIPEEPPGEVITIADFEETAPQGIAIRGGEGEPMAWEVVTADGGQCLRATVADLEQWQYVELPITGTGDERLTILRFRARGDASTPLLGLELNETDDSRWKYVVPLSEQWREYRIFIPHFLSYATEDRGGEGDYLHPEQLSTLSFGFTRGMVGEGPHTIWLDDIQRWEFAPPSREAVPRDRTRIAATAAAYGKLVKLPAEQELRLVEMFATSARFEGAALQATGGAGILQPGDEPPGRWSGWAVHVQPDGRPAYEDAAIHRARVCTVMPLLTAHRDGRELGPAAMVLHPLEGWRGSSIGCLCLDASDIRSEPMLAAAVTEMADYLLRRPRILAFRSVFRLMDGIPTMILQADVATPLDDGQFTLLCRVTDLDGTERWRDEMPVDVKPGSVLIAEVPAMPADRFDLAHYRASVDTVGDGDGDRAELVVDTRGVMQRLCDFFVEAQSDDGTFAGSGYVDERAARGLLAMYELTGDERYRQAAIRWGDHEIAQQREDGGYRMGYGIKDTGEACYVADGGEIAIGMARLVEHVPDDRRDEYVQSLRDYFRYRESFRLDDGKIGVGWVFHARYTAAGGEEVYEEPVRSDKSFGFVCGCTLAATAAWAEIADDPAVREMARHDARWFLEDELQARSVFAEAAQWAHYFIDDPEIRAGLEERMRETLLPFVAQPDGWWFASGGRSGVTLGALNYYHQRIDPSPQALTGVMRGLYYTVADASPSRLQKIIEKGPGGHNEWRYLCYSAVSLAEILEPTITMRDIAG
ncbi:MAG: hypothetical protein U9R79_09215 [Armatimonadota bacterium]|nr:hypothetical protein [Armatimonadota bacterium]